MAQRQFSSGLYYNGNGRRNFRGSGYGRGSRGYFHYQNDRQQNNRYYHNYHQQQQQTISNNINNNNNRPAETIKNTIPKEVILSKMKVNDGGIYTDSEEEMSIMRKTDNSVSPQIEAISQESILVQQAKQIYVDRFDNVEEVTVFDKDKNEEIVEITEQKIREVRISSAIDNFLEDNNNINEETISSISAGIESQKHVYYGKEKTCDWDFKCGPLTFHVHQQFIENFIENLDELSSGAIEDWFAMKKIFEILYEHKLADEKFLKCYQGDTEMSGFWETGNRIMHLANRLGIKVVKNYMDRAVAFYRCDIYQECNNCSQRKIFASIFGLEETKNCLDNNHTASEELEFALDDFI